MPNGEVEEKKKEERKVVFCGHRMHMCEECDRKAGYGKFVRIRYTNTGGYHPDWEGYVCEHLSAKDALEHEKEMLR